MVEFYVDKLDGDRMVIYINGDTFYEEIIDKWWI